MSHYLPTDKGVMFTLITIIIIIIIIIIIFYEQHYTYMYHTFPILVHVMSHDGIHNMKKCLTKDMNRKVDVDRNYRHFYKIKELCLKTHPHWPHV
jgi:hypothetical protein